VTIDDNGMVKSSTESVLFSYLTNNKWSSLYATGSAVDARGGPYDEELLLSLNAQTGRNLDWSEHTMTYELTSGKNNLYCVGKGCWLSDWRSTSSGKTPVDGISCVTASGLMTGRKSTAGGFIRPIVRLQKTVLTNSTTAPWTLVL